MTTFYERPFPESVKDAPLIVRGNIGRSWTDWSGGEDGNRRIYTFYETKVDEIFKGDVTAQSIVIRELGGEKDGRGMEVSGAAKFQSGEDVVIFLNLPANPDGSYAIRGLMMGKYDIRRDEAGQEQLIGPGISNDHSHGGAGEGSPIAGRRYGLEDLRQIVKDQGDAPKLSKPTPIAVPAQSKPGIASLPSPSVSGGVSGSANTAVAEASPPELSESDAGPSWAPWVGGVIAVIALWGGAVRFRRRRSGR